MRTHFDTVDVDGTAVFQREAGDPSHPTILLLHSFPASSHMFSGLISRRTGTYHVAAPDLPGFDNTEIKPRDQFVYTFDNITHVVDRFTGIRKLTTFSIYIFDDGAPIGLRIAAKHPKRITAITTQNGNSYLEDVSAAFNLFQAYARSEANGGFRTAIDETLATFLRQVDPAALATANAAGQPMPSIVAA